MSEISFLAVAVGEAGAEALDLVCGEGPHEHMRTLLMDTSGVRLDASSADVKILLPRKGTERQSAIDGAALRDALRGVDIAFIIASDRGTSGLSEIPMIADAARRCGTASVAFLIQFHDEDGSGGWRDDEYRSRVIDSMRATEAIFYVPYREGTRPLAVIAAYECISAIYGSVFSPGASTITSDDLTMALSGAGGSVLGVGEATGQNAAIEAARDALGSSTLDRGINGSTRVTVFIVSGPKTTREELEEAVVIIAKAADDDVRGIMWGHTVDPSMGSVVRVVMLASNFDDMKDRREEMRRQVIGFLDRISYRYSDAEPDEITFGINLASKVSTVRVTMTFGNDGYMTVTLLPIKALPEYRDEVMRFITMVNARLRIGSFSLDLDDGEIWYRTYTCYEGMVVLSDAVINRSFEIGASVVDEYGNALMDVIMGYADADTAIGIAEPEDGDLDDEEVE